MGMRIHGGQSNWAVQSQSVGDWQKRQAGIKNIKSALDSNDLAGAQQAFDSLNIDPSKLSSSSPLGKLGAALKSGDINAAQQAAQGLGHRHQHGQETQSTNSTQAATDPGFMQLIAQSLATTLNTTKPKDAATGDSSQSTQSINAAQNVSQTLSAFMQQLMTALEPQNASGSGTASSNAGQGSSNSSLISAVSDADGDNDGSKFQQALTSANAFQGPPSPKFNSYMQAMGGQIKTNLDNLLQQLSGGGSSDNSSTAALQTSFSSFIGALGGQADNSTLTSFLQNMQKNLQYGSTAGNLLNITA